MFLMTTNKQSISALRLQQLMGFGCYRTALRWLRELRRAMSHVVDNQVLGPIVEADEMYVGHRASKSNRVGTEVRIAGVVECLQSGCGRARLKVISEAASTKDIQTFVRKSVKSGSLIKSDGLAAYEVFAAEGYLHDGRVVTTLKGTKKLENGTPKVLIHLPNIHRVFSLVQRVLLGAHQGACTPRHLQGYLDEYCFRFNRRNDSRPLAITQRLTDAIVMVKAVPYWRSCGRKDAQTATKSRTRAWTNYAEQFRVATNG